MHISTGWTSSLLSLSNEEKGNLIIMKIMKMALLHIDQQGNEITYPKKEGEKGEVGSNRITHHKCLWESK